MGKCTGEAPIATQTTKFSRITKRGPFTCSTAQLRRKVTCIKVSGGMIRGMEGGWSPTLAPQRFSVCKWLASFKLEVSARGSVVEKFEGDWVNGKMHGHGKCPVMEPSGSC